MFNVYFLFRPFVVGFVYRRISVLVFFTSVLLFDFLKVYIDAYVIVYVATLNHFDATTTQQLSYTGFANRVIFPLCGSQSIEIVRMSVCSQYPPQNLLTIYYSFFAECKPNSSEKKFAR
jgi:hypothetical protein